MNGAELLNATLDAIKNTDPIAQLAVRLIEAGVTEAKLLEALKQRGNDPIAIDLHNAFRDVSRGTPTTNKWGVVCRTKVK